MAKTSSKSKAVVKVKAAVSKPFECIIAGLVFMPKDRTDDHYMSVHAWVTAGRPNGAYVYDNADTLLVCGIPICDGAPLRGMYRRIPTRKPRKAQIILVRHLLKDLKQAVVKTTTKGVEVAEVKEHHKMVY